MHRCYSGIPVPAQQRIIHMDIANSSTLSDVPLGVGGSYSVAMAIGSDDLLYVAECYDRATAPKSRLHALHLEPTVAEVGSPIELGQDCTYPLAGTMDGAGN